MDNSTLQAIKDAISKHNSIGIVIGKNPTLDGMGASLALYLGLKQLGKDISVACPSDPLVEISSLVGIDKVKTNLSAEGGDLVVSFPYKEGEIEKVSYTLENGYLNIVVKAGVDGLSFNEREVKYKRQGALPTLLFVIGTPRLSDLGTLFDPTALKDTTVVNIDNKTENQGFGEIVNVSPKFSSVSEMIGDLLLLMEVSLDVDMAQNLLSGINYATDNFQDAKTSYLAFEIAAVLMKKGAVRKPVREAVVDQYFKPRAPMQQQENRQQQPFNRLSQQPRGFGSNFPGQRQFPKKVPQQQQPRDMGNNMPLSQNTPSIQPKDDQEAPSDWLTPKVYKGSTNLE